MANLFITGALGHIGSRLIHELKPGEFEQVYLLDNLSTQRYSSLFRLPQGVDFQFIEGDICNAELDQYIGTGDIVIHLAAITDATASFEKSQEVERVNLLGTQRVAEACVRQRAKLFFPSTTSVYGTQAELVDENCPIADLKPQSPYANNKLKSEQLLTDLGKKQGLKFIICRLGTIYGTSVGMRFHTAVNKFCWQAVMGQPITVWKTAYNQKRPYLDVADCVRAMRFIIAQDLFDRTIYNVVSVNKTVKDITDIIASFIPDVEIKFVDTAIMNQLSYEVSSERFAKKGFSAGDTIRQGIAETLQLLQSARARKKQALI
ncbi:MAG: nucleoside-diphosphate sugar epimerase [Omnitrophica WOR_2 bacterium RIFCSPHIGHO2_01_FULL_48_9]|nr:MAG: nucleoside-diphosphate sugar epimerase [Omnitrophica WOR_2 bacterium RIFCSPHIGHO2_01_FULL_48_9]